MVAYAVIASIELPLFSFRFLYISLQNIMFANFGDEIAIIGGLQGKLVKDEMVIISKTWIGVLSLDLNEILINPRVWF